MTDREPGTPDDAPPADESQPDPFADEATAADDAFDSSEEEPAVGYFDAEGPDDESADANAADDEGASDEDEEEAEEDLRAAAAPAGRGSRITSGGQPRPGTSAAGPSVSERAVHLDDRASALFVLAIVATFVGIFLYGMLAGSSGFFTPLPTETPFVEETESPSASPSIEPSVSASPSVSPSGASASPGASPSGSAGASPSATAGASPSASTTRPSASASASAAPPSASPSP